MKVAFSAFARGLASTLASAAMIAALLVIVPDPGFAQCALCRDAVAASSPETREALNYAIMGLAFTPYVVAVMAAWALSPALRARVRSGLRRLGLRLVGEPR